MDVIEDIDDFYTDNFDPIKNEIVSAIMEGVEEGIEEGVKEGIKKGVKDGILEGLNEYFELGFLHLRKTESKKLEEILKDVATETIEKKVKDSVKNEICPVVKSRMNGICNDLNKLIKKYKITTNPVVVDAIKLKIKELTKKKINEVIREVKPQQNFVLTILFDGLHKAISECLIENINKCAKKIQDEMKHGI